jgi:hypothetical protein
MIQYFWRPQQLKTTDLKLLVTLLLKLLPQLLPQQDYDTDFLKASTAGELRDPSCG